MPSRPLSPCRRPGCTRVTRNPGGYCDIHQDYAAEQQRQRMARKETTPFYLSPRWRRLRDWYIGQHPVCEMCGRARATEVDHIREIKDGGAAMSTNNLQALCHRCHMGKTAAERRKREQINQENKV